MGKTFQPPKIRLVHLYSCDNKIKTWKQSRKLRGTNIFINNDYSKKILEVKKHRMLNPKKTTEWHNLFWLKHNKLITDLKTVIMVIKLEKTPDILPPDKDGHI